jgi:Domain of unknown function (DUF4440)
MAHTLPRRPTYSIVRFTCAFILFLNFSMLTGTQAPARQARSQEIAGIESAEETFRQAELKYDTASANAILADEFVGTGNHGERFDKKAFVSLVGDKADPLEVLEYGEMEVKVYGESAVVWSTIHEKAVYGGKVDEYQGRRTAMWVKRNLRWRCVTIHTSAFDQDNLQKN